MKYLKAVCMVVAITVCLFLAVRWFVGPPVETQDQFIQRMVDQGKYQTSTIEHPDGTIEQVGPLSDDAVLVVDFADAEIRTDEQGREYQYWEGEVFGEKEITGMYLQPRWEGELIPELRDDPRYAKYRKENRP